MTQPPEEPVVYWLAGLQGAENQSPRWPEIPEAIRRAMLAMLETVPNQALAPGAGEEAVTYAAISVHSGDLAGGVDPIGKCKVRARHVDCGVAPTLTNNGSLVQTGTLTIGVYQVQENYLSNPHEATRSV